MKKRSKVARRITIDRLFTVLVSLLSLSLLIPLTGILLTILSKGFSVLSFSFFTELPKPIGEQGGGIANAILGTLMLIFYSSLMAVPFGVVVGIFLSEKKASFLSKWVRIAVETLQGIPSIVFGVIAYIWIVLTLGQFSILSGSLALALIMFPVICKTSEESMSLIPTSLKEASLALGVSYYVTVLKVMLPAARKGIISGVLLGVARISGETAPLLFTAFGNPYFSVHVLKSVNAVPLLIYNYATSPYQEWQNVAWGASFVLVMFVLLLSIVSRVVSR